MLPEVPPPRSSHHHMIDSDASEAYLWSLAARSLRLHGDDAAAEVAEQQVLDYAIRPWKPFKFISVPKVEVRVEGTQKPRIPRRHLRYA